MDQCRVLIVDDEEDTRELLSIALKRERMNAESACNGVDALAYFKDDGAKPIDVLVTDLVMPKMNGIELLESFRSDNISVVKIVMTSFAYKENVMSALSSGADYLIVKPFHGIQLKAVIENLLAEGVRTSVSEHGDDYLNDIFQRRLMSLPITETEKRIVALVARGASNEGISEALGISHQTVKNRMSLIYRKLGISTRSEIFMILFPI